MGRGKGDGEFVFPHLPTSPNFNKYEGFLSPKNSTFDLDALKLGVNLQGTRHNCQLN
jgi:hypothetical protein